MPKSSIWNRELVEKYNISGPRYTSYPTALQFSDDFTAEDLKKTLSALMWANLYHFICISHFVKTFVITVLVIKLLPKIKVRPSVIWMLWLKKLR